MDLYENRAPTIDEYEAPDRDLAFDAELDSVVSELRNNAHLQLHHPQWSLYSPASSNETHQLQNCLEYIGRLRENWRPADDVLAVPASWLVGPPSSMNSRTQSIRSFLKPFQPSEASYLLSESTDDDLISSIAVRIWNSFDQGVLTVHEAIAGAFASLSSCQVSYRQATFSFSPHFLQSESIPSWAVIFNDVEPTRSTTQLRAINLPATLLHPALLIGVTSTAPYESTIALNQLANLVQPNLESLLIAFQYRNHQEQTYSLPPPELVLFGLYCTPTSIHIVAHVAEFDSTTNFNKFYAIQIDELPFPGQATEADNALAATRIVIALAALRSHIAHLQTLVDGIQWPHILTDWDTMVIEQTTGILTPTPSVVTDGFGDLGNAELESEDPAYNYDTVAKSKQAVASWLPGIHDE